MIKVKVYLTMMADYGSDIEIKKLVLKITRPLLPGFVCFVILLGPGIR